jgi:hypothetical protein
MIRKSKLVFPLLMEVDFREQNIIEEVAINKLQNNEKEDN